MIHYAYTDTELNKIMKTMTIVVDTREQVNGHILEYLRSKNVSFKLKKLYPAWRLHSYAAEK